MVIVAVLPTFGSGSRAPRHRLQTSLAQTFKVDQLFRAQLFHERRLFEERRGRAPSERDVKPVVPFTACANQGHGGSTATKKLTKVFFGNGAAGIHIVDQKPGTKNWFAATWVARFSSLRAGTFYASSHSVGRLPS